MIKLSEPSVAAVMTPAPITLTPDVPLPVALRTMARHSFRHVPIVDGGLFVGIVSERDVLAARNRDTLVRDVMTTDCFVTRPDAPAAVAAQTLLTMKIGCLPVLEDGVLVGIVTETDYVRIAYAVLSAVSASTRTERRHARPAARSRRRGEKRAHTVSARKH